MTQLDTQTLLSVLSAPALVCTRGGTVIGLNPAASTWLDIDGVVATGQSLGDLLHAPLESLTGFVERCSHGGQGVCNGHVYRRGDRSLGVAMSCHAQQLRGTRPDESLLLVFATDTRVRDEPKVQARQKGAVELHDQDALSEVALSEVALSLVHEANQPLTAIATYAHSCRRWLDAGRSDHPKLIPTLDKIIERVHATGRMISSLKGLVHGRDDDCRPCDLNQLVGESLDVLALDPRVERCTIESRPGADACPVLVSPVQIQLVLMNLQRNALEASLAAEGSDAWVRVAVTVDTEYAWATLSDSGAGVTHEASTQLFQPVMSGKSNGLGLGLAICRWLAIANAGRVDYHPGVPNGASFRLSLPIAR